MRIIRRDGRLTEADGYPTLSRADLEKMIDKIDFSPLTKEFKRLGFDVSNFRNCSLKDSRQGLSIDIMNYIQSQKNIGLFEQFMTYVAVGKSLDENRLRIISPDKVIWTQGWYLDCVTKWQQPIEELRDDFLVSTLNLADGKWTFSSKI